MMNSWDELSYEVELGAPYLFVEEYLMAGTLFIHDLHQRFQVYTLKDPQVGILMLYK